MIRWLRRTLHPAWYQGGGRNPPYFEGWYYKLIDATEQHRMALIPGVFSASDSGDSHAFIQVLDGASHKATYHKYPLEAFRASREGLDIRVGASRFTLERIDLEIESQDRSVAGSLSFDGIKPWPVTVSSPGAMGWFAWIPLLQTYHGILSFDHAIHGTLSVDGESIDFGGGRGYMEKDWGRSFPDAWIWMQTNHFDQPGISFTSSIATIPWLRTSFRGFIIGLWCHDRLYSFTTYTGAEIEELTLGGEEVYVVISDRTYRLEIAARGAEVGVLRGPTGLNMAGRVPESLQASVVVRLSAWEGDGLRLVFEGAGRNAGLEVVGDRSRLIT